MKFICWYANQGIETERHVDLEEPKCFEAASKSEALYKYLCWRAYTKKREPIHKSLSEHVTEHSFPEGGWGFNVKRLHDAEAVPVVLEFEEWYKQYAK